MNTLHISIDASAVSPSKAIAATARTGPLVCLTGRAFRDLADELGGIEGAMRHLLRVSENAQKPIAVNLPTGVEASRTVFLAPRSWTTERLQGWVAGHHEALESMFGAATPVAEGDW